MISALRSIFLLIAMLYIFMPAANAQMFLRPINIGILSFQPKSVTAQKWSILADYLGSKLPDTEYTIIPMTHEEMESALRQRSIDFALTNPGHYTQIRSRYGLSAPLVTVTRGTKPRQFNSFGGAIFTRADLPHINNLDDIASSKIATPSIKAFGAFQIQQFQLLQRKLPLIKQEQILQTGLPHDNVVHAIANGSADVGFTRAGTLERMAAKGEISLEDFKILAPQPYSTFPITISTHLYPEWPLVASSATDLEIQARVIVALLEMPQDISIRLPFDIKGFTPPADYSEVEHVLRSLRVSPFNKKQSFSFSDLWHTHHWHIALIIMVLMLMVCMSTYLLITNKALYKSKLKFKSYFSNDKLPKFILDPKSGAVVDANLSALNFYGYSQEDFQKLTIFDISTTNPSHLRKDLNRTVVKGENICKKVQHKLASAATKDIQIYSSCISLQQKPLIMCTVLEAKPTEGRNSG